MVAKIRSVKFSVLLSIYTCNNLFGIIHQVLVFSPTRFGQSTLSFFPSSVHELAATTADLFIAGAETTATALLWSLPILATYPDIQNKMFEEVIKHVGTERLPTVHDKPNLACVEAFYMEVLRLVTYHI